ncbi:MAG: GntR family transcriptional regulator [Eubacteriaceae bacterium]
MNNHNLAKYQIILENIKNMIYSGELTPGQAIPSENQLSKQFDISRVTVRKALSILSNEGYIFTVHGKGTFVCTPNFNDFTIQINKNEFNKSVEYDIKLIKVDIIEPDNDIKIHLQIYDNKKVVVLKRYILYNNEKIAYDIKYLPYNPKEPILEKEFHYINYQSNIFSENISQNIKKVINIRADNANESLSKILNINNSYPILIVEEKIKDNNEQIIGYGTTFFIGDKYKLTGI